MKKDAILRRLRSPICITLIVLASISCSQLATAAGPKKTTIVYQYNWYCESQVEDAYLALIKRFNETHPTIEVKGVRPQVGAGYDKLLAAIAAGVVPDIVDFEASSVIEWASKGLLMPLDELFNAEELYKVFFPGQCQEVIFKGNVWAIPWRTDARGLFWNVDLLEESGIDATRAPASIDELDRMAQKISRTDASGVFYRVGFIPWLGNWYPAAWFWAFGGEIYDPKTRRPTLDRVENIKAFEWVQGYAKLYSRTNLGAGDSFLSGKRAMSADCSSPILELLKRDFPDLNVRVGEVPHAPGGRNGTWSGGSAHIIPKGAKHPKEAMEFLKYLASAEVQLAFYEGTRMFPTNGAAIQAVIQREPPKSLVKPLLMQMPKANPRPPLWGKVIVELLNLQGSEIISLKKAPAEALANLQRRMVLEYEKVFGK